MTKIEFDPDQFDTLNEDAVSDLEKAFSEAFEEHEPDVETPWGDSDPVTEDDLEERLNDVGGVTEDEAAEIAQSYGLGALHHVVQGECDHPEHKEIRKALGLTSEGDGGRSGQQEESSSEGGSDEESNTGESGGSESKVWGTH